MATKTNAHRKNGYNYALSAEGSRAFENILRGFLPRTGIHEATPAGVVGWNLRVSQQLPSYRAAFTRLAARREEEAKKFRAGRVQDKMVCERLRCLRPGGVGPGGLGTYIESKLLGTRSPNHR